MTPRLHAAEEKRIKAESAQPVAEKFRSNAMSCRGCGANDTPCATIHAVRRALQCS